MTAERCKGEDLRKSCAQAYHTGCNRLHETNSCTLNPASSSHRVCDVCILGEMMRNKIKRKGGRSTGCRLAHSFTNYDHEQHGHKPGLEQSSTTMKHPQTDMPIQYITYRVNTQD